MCFQTKLNSLSGLIEPNLTSKVFISKWSESYGLKSSLIGKCTDPHEIDLTQALSGNDVRIRLGTDSLTICNSVKTLDRDLISSNHVTYRIQASERSIKILNYSPGQQEKIEAANYSQLVCFAFNFRLINHMFPLRDDANMLLMEDICRMMTCCLVHKKIFISKSRSSLP